MAGFAQLYTNAYSKAIMIGQHCGCSEAAKEQRNRTVSLEAEPHKNGNFIYDKWHC